MEPLNLKHIIDTTFNGISQSLKGYVPQIILKETGVITTLSTGVVKVEGLPGVGFEELLVFPEDLYGIAFNVDQNEIGVVLLGEYSHLHTGDEVKRTGRVMDVAVGDSLIGRVINPLGEPLDNLGPITADKRLPIERPAPAIVDREPVTVPLQTGIKVIDALSSSRRRYAPIG